jgi:glycerol kinase
VATRSARAMAEAGDALFGTVDSFLVWKLTGGLHVTDVTNASRTQLMDLASLQWSAPLLEIFNIPAACLPRIVASSEVVGPAGMELRGVPIGALLGDQHAAMVGQACFEAGQAKNTYGTGNFLLLNTGQTPVQSNAGLITTVAFKFGEAAAQYALEGSIAVTGALVQWLRDNLGLVSSATELDLLAASVPDNGGVYIVPAFSGLYAPYWREDARGIIAGLTRYANRAHLCRAALEAACYQTSDVMRAMQADAGVALNELRVDGGMVRSNTLLQFQADILDTPVVRPVVTETTALGAAYAAGLATGFWSGQDELRAHWQADRRFAPNMATDTRCGLLSDWARAVDRALGWEVTA